MARSSRRGSAEKLLSLIGAAEWEGLTDRLGLGSAASRATVAKTMSRTTLLQLVQSEAGTAMAMLGDVLTYLQGQEVRARTTNVVQTLPGLARLRPQQRDLALDWSAYAEASAQPDPSLLTAWETAKVGFGSLAEAARPRDGERAYWHRPSAGLHAPRQKIHDISAATHFEKLLEQVTQALPIGPAPSWVEQIRSDVLDLTRTWNEIEMQIQDGSEGQESDCSEGAEPIRSFLESLGDKIGAIDLPSGAANLLATDIFRDLPQLYEVWVLCTVPIR